MKVLYAELTAKPRYDPRDARLVSWLTPVG